MNRGFHVVLVVAVIAVVGLVAGRPARAERLRQSEGYEVLQGPVAGAVYGQPVHSVQRPVSYKRHPLLGPKCNCCLPPLKMVLQVTDPCTGCLVDVPVCIPGCCCDVPSVCCRRGLFGRSIVSYEWCCGFHLNVIFDRHGCVSVHYFGG
jgi:hypothetical protein